VPGVPPVRRPRFARRRRRPAVLVAAIALIAAVVVVVIVLSSGGPPPTGYDVSYPQCSGSYPSNPLWAIVGVNGGIASNTNKCLNSELSWARTTPGQRRPQQDSVSFYIDTGNPGAHQVATWPSGGTAPVYGKCNGKLTNSCSYLYGEQRAAASFRLAAASSASEAKTAAWWLDVELEESWAGTYALNIAALQGFVAGIHNSGATGSIGIYSTSAQWKEITGLTAQTTTAAFKLQLTDWVAGGATTTLSEARANCADGGFTGVDPTLAQYGFDNFDADLRCGS
jgi:hypothetical protein